MARPVNPLSKRSRNRTFTGAQVAAAMQRAPTPPDRALPRVRRASDFDLARLVAALQSPRSTNNVYSWTLEQIRNARDDQMRGKFEAPARMAKSMRTDDAIYPARLYRLAPLQEIAVRLEPSKLPGGERAAKEAEPLFGDRGTGITRPTIADLVGQLTDHGLAIAYNVTTPRDDGSRIDLKVNPWPIEWVEWDETLRCLVTRIDSAPSQEYEAAVEHARSSGLGRNRVPIVHGDGRWIVFKKHDLEPWTEGAAILPAAMVWSRHAFAARDWAKGSASHGNAKVVGELPEGVSLQAVDEDGNAGLTAEAAAFLALLQDIASQDQPVGIRPAGSKTDYVTNGSGAWQVWERLMTNAEKAAARIYLGTDGILGAQGGAPGVDITALFGVATAFVQGDIRAIQDGLATGALAVWAALNFGDSRLAPERLYQLPDADEEAVRESFAKRNSALFADMKAAKDAGCIVDQAYVNSLAEKHGVPAPQLAVAAPSGAGFFAYELEGGIVTIDEVRATKGLAPIANGTGSLTVPQAKALPPGAVPAAPAAPVDGAAPPGAASTDPDGDGEPGEPPTDESAQQLADKMTKNQVPACEHGAKNRCRLCGVERVRDIEEDENGEPVRDDAGNVVWKVAWRPIKK